MGKQTQLKKNLRELLRLMDLKTGNDYRVFILDGIPFNSEAVNFDSAVAKVISDIADAFILQEREHQPVILKHFLKYAERAGAPAGLRTTTWALYCGIYGETDTVSDPLPQRPADADTADNGGNKPSPSSRISDPPTQPRPSSETPGGRSSEGGDQLLPDLGEAHDRDVKARVSENLKRWLLSRNDLNVGDVIDLLDNTGFNWPLGEERRKQVLDEKEIDDFIQRFWYHTHSIREAALQAFCDRYPYETELRQVYQAHHDLAM